MLSAILVCCALVGQNGPSADSHSGDLASYVSAEAKAGDSADAHVRLALWCEAHGLSAEGVKHLAAAVMYDPSHALARGLMGLVAYQGKWGKPEVIGQQIHDDPAREQLNAEYRERRLNTVNKPDDQLRLAAWCERNGLGAEAFAHYSVVLRLDPSRESVWRHLGYRKSGNHWLKPEEIAAEQQEALRQKRADKRWGFFFERLVADLDSKDPRKVASAERRISTVSDTRAVPMIWGHFVRGSERRELVAVRMLGQIEGAAPATGLAAMAVFSPRPAVRRQATETLARYDPRDIVEQLIDVIQKPFSYQVRPAEAPGAPAELFVEGERFNIRRFYQNQSVVPALWGARVFAPPSSFDPFSGRNASMASPDVGAIQVADLNPNAIQDPAERFLMLSARAHAQELRGRALSRDVQRVESSNVGIRDLNNRALAVLNAITGNYLGEDSEKWKCWWADQLGYTYQRSQPEEKPTYTSFATEPPPELRLHHSCFGAGTLVRTLEGSRAIESVQVGDRVLSQDGGTGLLRFEPVLAVYHNKPAPTIRLTIGGEPIVVTGIHRFWKAGKGWTMARELKAGDRLRAVGSIVQVESTESSKVQPVFNLEVAENRDYFVGQQGMLVHDNSLVQPVLEPFDRPADLAAIAESSK